MMPIAADALMQSGVDARNRGELQQAVDDLQAAYAIYPTSPRLWMEMARCCVDGRDFARAISIMEDVVKVQPQAPEVRYELGLLNESVGDYDQALYWHSEAIRIHRKRGITKGLGLALMGAGACYARLGEHSVAHLSFERAIQVHDNSPAHRFGRGLARLARADWKRGWTDFEARWELHAMWKQQKGHGTSESTLPPRWDGKSPGRVFCYAEQGSGDTLWALRYLPQIPDVVLQVQPELVTFVQAATNRFTIPNGAPIPACEWSAPLMSLPYILKAWEPIPPRVVAGSWSKRGRAMYSPVDAFRVGVCWHGESKHANDMDRSCPEPLMNIVGAIEGVEAVSLQHGEPTQFASFLETASLIHSMDCVVTVDTAIAHLAGTLGVPTYVLPPTVPDWRWPSVNRDSTPWYPSVRLFRRTTSKDWDSALKPLALALNDMAHARSQ